MCMMHVRRLKPCPMCTSHDHAHKQLQATAEVHLGRQGMSLERLKLISISFPMMSSYISGGGGGGGVGGLEGWGVGGLGGLGFPQIESFQPHPDMTSHKQVWIIAL